MKTPAYTNGMLAAALCLLIGDTASAEIKNVSFQGTIDWVDDHNHLLDGSVTNGTAFEGYYVFDTSAPDTNADPTVGDYRFDDATFGVVVKVGSYVFRTNPRHVDFLIELVNRPASDFYLFRSYQNLCSTPLYVGHIAWQLDDITGSALSGVELPGSPPDLTAFTSPFGLTIDGNGPLGGMPYMIRGTVDSAAETPVIIPERPVTTVGKAVEVSWPSRLGYFYQIQSSEDLEHWTDLGEPVLGTGETLSKFFPQDTTKQVFYRAEIANFAQ